MRYSATLAVLATSFALAAARRGGSSSSSSSSSGSKPPKSSDDSDSAPVPKPIVVSVGNAAGDLVFEPDTIKAKEGDQIEFHFWPENHSVVQGDFAKPCQPLSADAFYSDYVPSSSGMAKTVWTLTINNTDPIWLYCSYSDHCQEGMVGVINPEQGGSTLDEYKTAAAKAKSASAPAQAQGGILHPMGTPVSTGGPTGTSDSPAQSSSSGAAGENVVSGAFVGGLAGLAAWAML